MSLHNAIGGIALIAGTAIGAAVLALPVATAHLGFIPTLLLYALCWFFMLQGALYLLEVNLVIGYGTNLFSMADKTLGVLGKYATLGIYLILLYALTAAYLVGAGAWIEQGFAYFATPLNPLTCAFLATLLITLIISLGTAVTDWVNRILMIGLISAFAALIFVTGPKVQPDLLFAQQGLLDFRPLPIMITAFGSAIVIPTLTSYLHGKPRQLLMVVLLGSAIPLLVYVLWEITILGIIPLTGSQGLIHIQQQGQPVTDIPAALQNLLQNPVITAAAFYFSIFALLTSLLGVCLSLFDFLRDSFQIERTLKAKFLLALITFIPPLGFITFYPQGFTIALSFAGLFVALLLGILPALMVWQSRYRSLQARPLQIWGGKPVILLTLIFFTWVIGIECFNQYETWWLPKR